jgi:nitrile hydratase
MTDLPSMDAELRIPLEEGMPVFVEPWAARAFAIVLELFGKDHYSWPEWVDYFSAELGPAGHYRSANPESEKLAGAAADVESHYFELWLAACEKLLMAKEVMTKAEFDAKLAELRAALAPAPAPRFSPGDRIVVREVEPVGHAHLPLYVCGKSGVVVRRLGSFGFPESDAANAATRQQDVYSVRFRARELWGPDAPDQDSLHFSLFDGYLDPA